MTTDTALWHRIYDVWKTFQWKYTADPDDEVPVSEITLELQSILDNYDLVKTTQIETLAQLLFERVMKERRQDALVDWKHCNERTKDGWRKDAKEWLDKMEGIVPASSGTFDTDDRDEDF